MRPYSSSSNPIVRKSSTLERTVAMALKRQAATLANSSRSQGYSHCHYRVQDLRCRGFHLAGLDVNGGDFFDVDPNTLAYLLSLWLRDDGFIVEYRKIDVAVEGGYRYNFWIRW